ncbi:MAG TPA: uroporphyrinogen decarboxylase [Candidatus Limnocylindrales bacterium]|nr:uroporphyrinogen decarboxylase [Candidatus Limnocylindrales bacterium]
MNDRFLRACRREPVDVTPVWFMRQAGRALPEYREIRKRASLADIVADADLCAEVSLQPVTRLGVDACIVFADITTPLPGVGIPVALQEGVGPIIDPPIRNTRDVQRLGVFDPDASVGGLLGAISTLAATSPVPVIGFAGAPFTLAAYLVEGRSPRGLETTKTFMRSEPAAWDELLGRIVDMDLAYLTAQVHAGASVVQLFDSWVGALSPFDYRAHVLPHVRRLFEGLRALAVPTIHFGTGTAGLLEAMAEAGGDVIGLDWRVDLASAWCRLPERAVQGNLDPDVLLGPWADVEGQARHVLAGAAGRPGHVFNLGHGVLPATDPAVLARLVRLVHGDEG